MKSNGATGRETSRNHGGTVDLAVTLTKYSHSGQGFFSLSFRCNLCEGTVPEKLRRLVFGSDCSQLYMKLEDLRFRGVLQSAVSRKKHLVLTVHVRPTKYLVFRFFELVGKPALTLRVGSPGGAGPYLPREEYLKLKERVREKLHRLAGATGMDEELILYRETSRMDCGGTTTLARMKPAVLRALEARFASLLKE